jgi:hypothetical protein
MIEMRVRAFLPTDGKMTANEEKAVAPAYQEVKECKFRTFKNVGG